MAEGDKELDEGLHTLMALPEEERRKWCIGVVRALADALAELLNTKPKIKQAKVAKEFFNDLRAKKGEIQPVFLYMLKDEYRDVIVELMERFAGVDVPTA